MGGNLKWALIIGICWLALACNLTGLVEMSSATPTIERIEETPQESASPTEAGPTETQEATPSSEADIQEQTLQPCTLIMSDEAANLLGTDVQAPQEMEGTCAYNSQPDGIYLASVSAAQGEQTQGILEGLFLMAGLSGAQIDQAELERLQSLAQARDFEGFFRGLVEDTQTATTMKTRLLEDETGTGYWAWIDAQGRFQGALTVARDDTLVNLNLVVDASKDEQAALDAAWTQTDLAFQRLPQRFVLPVATETPEPSQTPTPTQTLEPSPTLIPSETPITIAPAPPTSYIQQASYTGDCLNRPADSVCLGYQDGFIWFIQPFNDSIKGWGLADPYQGYPVQVAYGQNADYYHVLYADLVMIVAH
jgi:hypothetical protein